MLDVSYEDGDDWSRLVYTVVDRDGGRREVPPQPGLRHGQRVRVSGNEVIALDVVAQSAWTEGPKSIGVILFNFADNPTSTVPGLSAVNGTNAQVANYYAEQTYGAVSLTFTVFSRYTISANNSGCNYTSWASEAQALAGVSNNDFDRLVFAFPHAAGCSWGAIANLGGPRSYINGNYSLRRVGHEQGHNFGSHHAFAWVCGNSCQSIEYGDDRDIMGQGSVTGHMNAFIKERLDWLDVPIVTEPGEYWLDNYESGAGVKAIKFPRPAGGFYYLESRAAQGFDANVPQGVTLHTYQDIRSYQLDLDGSSVRDTTLDVGQLYDDGVLRVRTISWSPSGALVRIGPDATDPPVDCEGTWGDWYPITEWSSCEGSQQSRTEQRDFLVTQEPQNGGLACPVSPETRVVTQGCTPPALTVTASAVFFVGSGGGRSGKITVNTVAGASLSAVVTSPTGAQTTLTKTADANGYALITYLLQPSSPIGVYQVAVTATFDSASGQASTSFEVTP